MKDRIVVLLMVFLAFVLQSTVFQSIAVAGVVPNLLIILTSSMGFMRGKHMGMFTGFCCGLFVDIFFGGLLGFYALVYLVLGYANGVFHRLFYPEEMRLPIVVIGVTDLFQCFIVCIALFMFKSKFHFWGYLIHVIIPEVVYTVVISILIYRLILWVDLKVLDNEKRI